MRKVRLGNYTVVVPPINITRYCDYPLPSDSAAVPAALSMPKGWGERHILSGHKLYGCMIPGQRIQREPNKDEDRDKKLSDDRKSQDVGTQDEIELQQLAEHKLRLAEAKAALDVSFGSQEEVERLQNLVEEMSHIDVLQFDIDCTSLGKKSSCEESWSEPAVNQQLKEEGCVNSTEGDDMSKQSSQQLAPPKQPPMADQETILVHQDQRDENDATTSEDEDDDLDMDDPFATYDAKRGQLPCRRQEMKLVFSPSQKL